MINSKIELKNRLLECDYNEWLEPALCFIKDLKTTRKIALSSNFEEKAELFKKVGLNRKLREFSIQYETRKAWRVLENKGVSDSELLSTGATAPTNNELVLGCANGSVLVELVEYFRDR